MTKKTSFVTWSVVVLAAVVSWAAANAQDGNQSAVPPLPSDIPAGAERFSVLLMGNLVGQQATWTAPDGSVRMFYQFNDRGRGPKTTTTLTLDAAGFPIAETVEGNDYLKSAVAEKYSLQSGTARWKNDYEEGEKALHAPAMYVSINGAPAEIAFLVRGALAAGGKLALLPDGEAKVQRIAERQLLNGDQKRTVSLYAITGLDFSPAFAWLDDEKRFFAVLNFWSAILPEGWEKAAPVLQEAQDQFTQARAADLAARLAHPAPRGIVFTHVNVFDAESGKIAADRNVVVLGNRIRSVSAGGPANVEGADVIDARDKTLLPGLWDMHAHLGDNDGLLNLAAGVTSVRDLGNDSDVLLARRKRIEEGKEIGTRIVLAGLIDGPGPYQGPTKVLVATEAEARDAVKNFKRLGYIQIKIYSSVKPELVPAIVDEAHRNGMRVSGHIPAGMTAAECVKLGYDEIQHANFLLLNFMPDVRDTNTPSRFTAVAKRAADLNLNSAEAQSFVQLLKERHTALDPTLGAFEGMFIARPGQIAPGYEVVARRLPPQVRRGFLTGGLTPPAGMDEQYKKSFAKMVDIVGLMYRSGISVMSGTDTLAGFGLHRELELHVQAGIPAAKVLQDATLGAARLVKMDRELGSIAPGKLADLILIDGNPLDDIADIRETTLVVKNGVWYRPAELYSAIGVAP